MFVVTGATGQTGSAVAKHLLKKDLPVRVIVRSKEKGAAWKDLGAEVAVADVHDAEALTRALEDAKALYLMNPPNYQSEDMLADVEKVIRAFRTAIEKSPLEKLVVLSSVGAHLPNGTGVVQTLHKLEKAFADSSIPTTILRPVSFMENWNSGLEAVKTEGVLPSFYLPLNHKFPQIATAEIGPAAAQAMTEKTEGTEIKELEGFYISPDGTAEAFAKVLGREVKTVPVPEDRWLEIYQSFCSPKNAAAMVELTKAINSGYLDFETENRMPGTITIDDYAREALK